MTFPQRFWLPAPIPTDLRAAAPRDYAASQRRSSAARTRDEPQWRNAPMGFRFRRSFRLIPGIRLNLSRSGVSTSIGRRGAWFTLGPRGARATVGSPGTGLSYTQTSPWARPTPHADGDAGIEVAELPHVDIDSPAVEPTAPAPELHDDDASDPRLVPIVLVMVGMIAVAVLLWAALA